jgi:signal transduction histidine kinase
VGEPGFSLADNPAFQQALRSNALTITPAGRGRLIGRDVFSYMRKVEYGSEVPRVVFVGFGLDTVSASMARVPLPADASLALVTTGGRVIAAYPPEGEGPMRSVADRLRATAAGTGVFTAAGGDGVTRAFATVRLGVPDDLLAVAALPTNDPGAADARILTAVLIFGAFSLVTLGIALAVANRGIRTPIQQLLDAMARVRQGNLSVRASLSEASPEVRALSHGFDEMTAQLEQRELRTRQAQRLEAVGQLAGGIAHDFNNMLTAIIGFGEELRPHVLPEGRANLDEVLTAGTRARDLTQQLLAFSRQQVLQAQPLQLSRAVEDLSRMLQRIIGEHIALSLQLESALPFIRADRTQLEQVITNLVVNARDAMPEGGTLVLATDSVSVSPPDYGGRTDLPPGRYARLRVTDTGHGMDAETASHIFEPFFTTKELGKGTGLGLATVYGVVRQSGGYVIVDSTRDRGTTFEIFFPVIEARDPQVLAPPPAERYSGGAGQTILVVEDEPSVRRLAATILRRAGYTVLEAGDAHTAMTVAASNAAIALLLTDVVLPGGPSGVSLGRALKAARPGLIVLHMSGYSVELSSMATPEERAAFLGKPFTPPVLLRTVHDALRQHAASVSVS